MRKQSKLIALTWLALMVFSASSWAAEQHSTQNAIPVSGIFVSKTPAAEPQEKTSTIPQSLMLAGLLVSVFVVIGTGRVYCQLQQRVGSQLAEVKNERRAIIKGSVQIKDAEVQELLVECDNVQNKIDNIDYQIKQRQMEV